MTRGAGVGQHDLDLGVARRQGIAKRLAQYIPGGASEQRLRSGAGGTHDALAIDDEDAVGVFLDQIVEEGIVAHCPNYSSFGDGMVDQSPAGWIQTESNGPSRRRRPAATQLSATPPAMVSCLFPVSCLA